VKAQLIRERESGMRI